MDLSSLSTDDLKALQAGDMGSMSSEGLKHIAGQTVAPPAPQSGMGQLEAFGQNLAQGATMGTADEIGHGLAYGLAPLSYGVGRGVNAIENLFDAGNPNPPSYDQFRENLAGNKQSTMMPSTQFNSEHPWLGGAEQAAGGVASMGALAKLTASLAPESANAISAWAKANPLKAAAGAGAVSGEAYGIGTGEGDLGTRAKDALPNMATGAVAGPFFTGVAKNVVAPIARKGMSALENFLKSSEEEATIPAAGVASNAPVSGAPSAPPAPPPVSSITNEPLGGPVSPQQVGPASQTGILPLSPGQRTKDPNLLRVEDKARHGLIGNEAQVQINAVDANVRQDALRAVQQLSSVKPEDSQTIFADAVKQFQDTATKSKAAASANYAARDSALNNAVLNKRMAGPTLGKAIDDVAQTPGIRASLKVPGNSAAADLIQQFKTMVTSPGKELPMEDYLAWRKSVSDVQGANFKNQTGFLAGKIGRAADDWLENKFSQKMLLSGDENISDLIKTANDSWASYKSTFGSKDSSLIEGIAEPWEKTPEDLVSSLVGDKSVAGTSNTAFNLRKMHAALPSEVPAGSPEGTLSAQEQFKKRVFQGFMARVMEKGDNGDTTSLKNLRNNLSQFQSSQTYKEFFANDPEKDTVITNLRQNLSQYLEQRHRGDVVSPSGKDALRGLRDIVAQIADVPIVSGTPGVKTADTIMNKMNDMKQSSVDRSTFNKAMKETASEIRKAAKQGKVFDVDSLKMGLIGGVGTKDVVNNKMKKETKE